MEINTGWAHALLPRKGDAACGQPLRADAEDVDAGRVDAVTGVRGGRSEQRERDERERKDVLHTWMYRLPARRVLMAPPVSPKADRILQTIIFGGGALVVLLLTLAWLFG